MGKLSSMTSPTPALMNDRLSATPTAAAGGTPPAESADLALPRGLRLGAFEIQRVLARSASSIVYLATDHALAMPVALQEYLPARLTRRDTGLLQRAAEPWQDDVIDRGRRAFIDETRLLAGCDHPALVRVTQLFEALGSAYRVMPVYTGPRLSDVRSELLGAPKEATVRALLDQLGRRESDHTWRLSAGGVRAALDAGRTGQDLLAELRRRSRHGVPAVVEQLVRDMAQAHGRIRVHAAKTVLQLDDPVLGVELVHDRRLRALGLVEIAPGVLGSVAPPAQVVAALRYSGHAPTGEGAAPPSSPDAPAKRSARPVVHPRPWGHPASQVVAALRAGPAQPAPAPPVAPGGRAALKPGLLARLAHLGAAERMLLVEAVLSGGPVELDYVDAAGEPTTRVVHGLEDTGHLLLGWCRLRQDERMFAPLGILAVRPAR